MATNSSSAGCRTAAARNCVFSRHLPDDGRGRQRQDQQIDPGNPFGERRAGRHARTRAVGRTVGRAVKLTAFPLAVTHTAYGIRQMPPALEITERIRLQPVVTTDSLTVLKEFVKQELGVSCLPDFAVAREVDAGDLFTMPLLHPVLETAEAHLITRAGRRLSGAAVRMLQLMTAQLRSLR
ncbi:MAG: LysR substrate-binding domain-containing protein [Janthinobacterium lividum]